jgi:serine protease Do
MKFSLAALALLMVFGPAQAQPISSKHQRDGVPIRQAFREVVERPSQCTVRVRCADKDIALGTIVDAGGWILTKAGELDGPVTCRLPDGRSLAAQIVGVSEPYDLALLKVEARELPVIAWRPAHEMHVGQWVASTGPTPVPVAVGVISVGPRKLKAGDQPPKSRGGKSGWLGVALDEGAGGAHIIGVERGSPAAAAGLKVQDIVTEVSGKIILDNESLINVIQRHHPGEEIALKVRRGTEELGLKATLGRLPRNLRGNPQDRMGNLLSGRRGGFPAILQHDSVLKPHDCGGPLVDLDGKAVGINITRAGRTETYAIPSEDVLALLPALKSGKLAPTVDVTGPLSPAEKADSNILLNDKNHLTARDPAARARPGCYSRAYTLKLAAGARVIIDLESLEFDAFLHLEDAAGKKIAEDDDSGGDLDAHIDFRVPRDDTYRLIVTTCNPRETGNYELTVRKSAK